MSFDREQILADVVELLRTSARDWDFTGGITEDTCLFADLGFESLDVVVLATTVQERYGHVFPFTDFFAAVGQREVHDISVKEWADFIYTHLPVDVPALETRRQS